jgi:hypothetical protein
MLSLGEEHNGDGSNGHALIRRWRVGDRVRVRWQFTGGWLTGEIIKGDEVSVTMLWDNHTWGQFYYDSPFVWEAMVKMPIRSTDYVASRRNLVKRH